MRCVRSRRQRHRVSGDDAARATLAALRQRRIRSDAFEGMGPHTLLAVSLMPVRMSGWGYCYILHARLNVKGLSGVKGGRPFTFGNQFSHGLASAGIRRAPDDDDVAPRTFCFNRPPGVYSTLLLWPAWLRAASRQLSAGISNLINSDNKQGACGSAQQCRLCLDRRSPLQRSHCAKPFSPVSPRFPLQWKVAPSGIPSPTPH